MEMNSCDIACEKRHAMHASEKRLCPEYIKKILEFNNKKANS